MRTVLCVLSILIATAIGAAFYFGLCTIAAERDERTYVVRLVVHPDFMVPKQFDQSSQTTDEDQVLEARGKVASVSPTKSEFVLTENFKDLTFRVGADTTVFINDQAAKLADLKRGDEATVAYTRQGQLLNANVIRCMRKASTP